MRAMRAEAFTGYKDLKLVEIPKPAVSDGQALVRITAAGVTPLEHTILSGGYPRAKAPRSSWEEKERAWWRREGERRFLSVHV
jgi:NADPH:quinone reductase-like Zn-dependent oxidoreductase